MACKKREGKGVPNLVRGASKKEEEEKVPNLVRELVTAAGLLGPNFFDPKLIRIHQHFHFPELGQQRNVKNMAKWLKC